MSGFPYLSSQEITDQMTTSRKPGSIAQLVRDGHRNVNLFFSESWTQPLARNAIQNKTRSNRHLVQKTREAAFEGALEALEAGYPVSILDTPCPYSGILRSILYLKTPSLMQKAERWLEEQLNAQVFQPLMGLKAGEKINYLDDNDDLTLCMLSAAAYLGSLPLMKKAIQTAGDLILLNTPRLSSNHMKVPILAQACSRPEQLDVLKYLMDLTQQQKLSWPSPTDQISPYAQILNAPIANFNMPALCYLVNDFGLSIESPRSFSEYDQDQWDGALTQSLSVINSHLSDRESAEWFYENVTEMINTLLDLGAQVEPSPGDNLLYGLMHYPERSASYAKLLDFVLSLGINPDHGNRHDVRPLHQAVVHNNEFAVEKLIEKGVDLNYCRPGVKGLAFETALGAAAQRGHLEIFKTLVEHGANLDIVLKDEEEWNNQAHPLIKSWVEQYKISMATIKSSSSIGSKGRRL